jgi:hypothetical protein
MANIDGDAQNGFNDLDERFFESQENRLRILNALLDRGLPVDVSRFFYFPLLPPTLFTSHCHLAMLCLYHIISIAPSAWSPNRCTLLT